MIEDLEVVEFGGVLSMGFDPFYFYAPSCTPFLLPGRNVSVIVESLMHA